MSINNCLHLHSYALIGGIFPADFCNVTKGTVTTIHGGMILRIN